MAMIKCPECGREISDRAAACPGCGCPISSTTGTADREANKPETILMEGLCNQCVGMRVKNGSAILTNHRFVYLKHSIAKLAAMGVLANLTKGSYEYEIPLGDISRVEDSRHGISKTITIITTTGESYEFYMTKREEWKIKIESAISAF